MISGFHDLKALHGLPFVQRKKDDWNHRIITLLLQACPNLRRIDYFTGRMEPGDYCTERYSAHYLNLVNEGFGNFSSEVRVQDDYMWLE